MNSFSFCSVCALHVVKIALYCIFQQTYISVWNIFQDDVCEIIINQVALLALLQ